MTMPIPDDFEDVLNFVAEMVTLITEGNYITPEEQAAVIAETHSSEQIAFYLQTSWVMSAAFAKALSRRKRGGSVRDMMRHYVAKSMSDLEFTRDVLAGIDDLPGDPNMGFVD